jgi:hypothetical protein
MPKTPGVSSSASQSADQTQFVSVGLFSGLGLLAFLMVVLLRMNGVF